MSYVSGDGKPRRKIVLFLIGALIVFASAYVALGGPSAFGIPYLEFFRAGVLIGLGIQIFALFKMIVYDRRYAISLVAAIITFLTVLVFVVALTLDLMGVITFAIDGPLYQILSLIDTVAESVLLIFFVIATESLAEHSYHGTPKLALVLVIVYIFLAALDVFIFVGNLVGLTITIEWIAIVLYKLQNISSVVKFVGTLVFIICSLVYIKD